MGKEKIKFVFAFLLTTTGAMAQTPPPLDGAKRAVSAALKTYPTAGVAGLEKNSRECWKKSLNYDCFYADLAGKEVQALGTLLNGNPESAYFEMSKVVQRYSQLKNLAESSPEIEMRSRLSAFEQVRHEIKAQVK